MTTAIAQHQDIATAREILPPVEAAQALAASPVLGYAHAAIQPANHDGMALGKWVFNHKQSFSRDNPLAWYGVRNVVNNMVSIVGLMATIVPVRMGMGHVAKWAQGRNLTKLQHAFGNSMLQNSLGVGVSFSTFRVMYKMGQRAYDRVFIQPEDANQTAQAIKDLPQNWWKDFKQIAPSEYPATMVASFGLVGVRSAFTPHAPGLRANHWQDVAVCAAFAYPLFFEITEHLGRNFQLARGYDTKETNEHIDKDKQTMREFLTRQVPGVAAGIIPYIHFNNIAHRTTGRQASYKMGTTAHGIDGFGKAFWKERPYQFFWMFSLGRDLYFDAYDRLMGKPKNTTTAAHMNEDAHGKFGGLDAAPESIARTPSSQVHAISEHHKAIGPAPATPTRAG